MSDTVMEVSASHQHQRWVQFEVFAILSNFLFRPFLLGAIYDAIYKDLLARQEVVSITVESPNDAFSALRDHCDIRHLMTDKRLRHHLPIPFGIDLINDLARVHKLHKVGGTL
jgi:hypothetical protein